MVVHLEVFAKWARHASPLHRYAPYWTGIVCVGVSERRSRSPLRIIGVNLRNLRFDSLPLWGGRGRQSGSVVVRLEVFAKWARHASPLHRYAPYWTGIVCVGVSGRSCIRRRDQRTIGDHLRKSALSVVPSADRKIPLRYPPRPGAPGRESLAFRGSCLDAR